MMTISLHSSAFAVRFGHRFGFAHHRVSQEDMSIHFILSHLPSLRSSDGTAQQIRTDAPPFPPSWCIGHRSALLPGEGNHPGRGLLPWDHCSSVSEGFFTR